MTGGGQIGTGVEANRSFILKVVNLWMQDGVSMDAVQKW